MNPLARLFDRLLGILKWPIAIAALILVPGLVYALFLVIRGIAAAPGTCVPFLLGAAAYSILWLGLGSRRIGFWTTLEHELTHAIFAWATLHPMTWRTGGEKSSCWSFILADVSGGSLSMLSKGKKSW